MHLTNSSSGRLLSIEASANNSRAGRQWLTAADDVRQGWPAAGTLLTSVYSSTTRLVVRRMNKRTTRRQPGAHSPATGRLASCTNKQAIIGCRYRSLIDAWSYIEMHGVRLHEREKYERGKNKVLCEQRIGTRDFLHSPDLYTGTVPPILYLVRPAITFREDQIKGDVRRVFEAITRASRRLFSIATSFCDRFLSEKISIFFQRSDLRTQGGVELPFELHIIRRKKSSHRQNPGCIRCQTDRPTDRSRRMASTGSNK